MTYPIQDEKTRKTKAEDDMISLFTSSNSWEEFCLKATSKYGIDVSGMFNKWHIAYCVINHGDNGVFQCIALILAALSSFFIPAGFAYVIVLISGSKVIAGAIAVAMVIAIMIYSMVSIMRFGEFTAKLQQMQYYC